MVTAVVLAFFVLAAALKLRTPRRWFGRNLILADNFPDEDEDEEVLADAAKLFAAKEERDMLTRIIMLVFWFCATLYKY